MNAAERMVLFVIGESPGADFARLSLRFQMATPQLTRTLDSLVRRNFIIEEAGCYRLQTGVMQALPAL